MVKKDIIIWLGVCCLMLFSTANAFARDMRVNVSESSSLCDAQPFARGLLAKVVLNATNEIGGDAIEVHYRSGRRSPAYQAKRVRVAPNDYVRHLQWTDNGKCVRSFQDSKFQQVTLNSNVFLRDGEMLQLIYRAMNSTDLIQEVYLIR